MPVFVARVGLVVTPSRIPRSLDFGNFLGICDVDEELHGDIVLQMTRGGEKYERLGSINT